MAYPGWFRKKVLAYRKAHGLSMQATADHFKIGVASVMRWHTKPEPAKTRNKPALKIPDEQLRADVLKYPDDYTRDQ